jgi:UMF1 family MFS transporter
MAEDRRQRGVIRTGLATWERFGWVMYDWANSAFILCVVTVVGAQYFVNEFETAARKLGDLHIGPAPAMNVLGLTMPAEAAWAYAMAAAALIVVLVSPVTGALADAWSAKKRFLAGYCALGVAACLVLALPVEWWAIGLLIVVGTVGFQAGNVFYNGFLSEIAPADEQSAVSGMGYAVGYLGGVLALILALVLFTPLALGHSLGPVRYIFAVVGLWWGGFALITFALVRERRIGSRKPGAWHAIGEAMRGLGKTMSLLAHHPQALRFLFAYLLYNDGVATLISNVTPYAMQNIYLDSSLTQHIGTAQLVIAIILVQVIALPGSLICAAIANRIGEKYAILLTLVVFTGAVAYGLFAHTVNEFYALASAVGLVLGGCQAISRALFASFIPRGRTAEFFAFFAMSDEVSAILGPATYGTLLIATGQTRIALASLAVFFVVGGALLGTVDVGAGRRYASGT